MQRVLVLNKVPNVSADPSLKYDFIVVTTKNIADVKPAVEDIIEPAVTPGHTTIVLLQNGLNIEKPVIAKFPNNVVLSGISLIGATENPKGHIAHDDSDSLKIGPYESPGVNREIAVAAAKHFVEIYNACGKVDCTFDEDVPFTRWRKLIYNASYNSVCTILRWDTLRMRMYEHTIDTLIRPAMLEIKATAKAAGVNLPEDICEVLIAVDPDGVYWKPSMCQDIEKVCCLDLFNGKLFNSFNREILLSTRTSSGNQYGKPRGWVYPHLCFQPFMECSNQYRR
jgi:2-dehydropantoate 2-reductase